MQFSGVLARPFIPFIDDKHTFTVSWTVASFALALVVSIYILRNEVTDFFQSEQKKIGTIILWSVLGTILAFVAQFTAVFIERFAFGIQPGSENTFQLMDIARQSPVFILVIALIGPILEELVFRKAIFGSLYNKMNFFFAALISGVIFAIVHMDFSHLLIYTAVGMVFAFLYIETKRIIVPIIAHMAMNSIAVIAQLSVDPKVLEEQLKQLEQLQLILIGG